MRHTVSVQKISQPRVECLLTTKGYGIVLCFLYASIAQPAAQLIRNQ